VHFELHFINNLVVDVVILLLIVGVGDAIVVVGVGVVAVADAYASAIICHVLCQKTRSYLVFQCHL